jgi:glycosyltransferase involved in cell wall biosynthesis
VYNVKIEFFKQCLDSILIQTFPDFELIVVDDGSSNGCEIVCDEYASKDLRVRIIHKQNAGVSAARNDGIINAFGKYIMFVDADDWVDAGMCQAAWEALSAKEYDLALFGAVRSYSTFETKPMFAFNSSGELRFPEDRLRLMDIILSPKDNKRYVACIAGPCCKAFRSEMLKSRGMRFDSTLRNGEDIVFNLQALAHVESAYYIAQSYYHYRCAVSVAHNKYIPTLTVDFNKFQQRTLDFINAHNARVWLGHSFHIRVRDQFMQVIDNQIYHPANRAALVNKRKEALLLLKSEPYRSAFADILKSDGKLEYLARDYMLKYGLFLTAAATLRLARLLLGRKAV